MNPFDPSDPQNPWFGFFPAQVQNPTNTNGVYRYPYVEVIAGAGTANYAAGNGVGRRGTNTVGWAREINNRNISNTGNAVVWMRYRGQQGGRLTPEFDGSGLSASGGGSLTVEDDDSSPSYAGITTLQFDQDQGFALSQPSNTSALVTLANASQTDVGVVNAGSQEFGGEKTFAANTTYGVRLNSVPYVMSFDAANGTGTAVNGEITFIPTATAAFAMSIEDPGVGTGNAATTLSLQGLGPITLSVLRRLNGSFIDPTYGLTDNTGVGRTGAYGVDGIGNVFHGGLVTSISSSAAGTNASDINSGVLAVAHGGTGATTEAGARSSLGANDAANINTGVLDEPYGGTGQTAYNTGDILYCSNATSTTLSRLPIGSNGQVLTVVSGLPAWATP